MFSIGIALMFVLVQLWRTNTTSGKKYAGYISSFLGALLWVFLWKTLSWIVVFIFFIVVFIGYLGVKHQGTS